MNKHANPNIEKQIWLAVPSDTAPETPSRRFEVNVIFTDREATLAAVKTAKSLARDLGARIRLLAAIVVPLRLPLDQPHISVHFMEQSLQEMMRQTDQDGTEATIELYVCRDWLASLSQILRPNSLVVLGDRKRWWTTPTSRLAQALRALGHRVALVDSRRSGAGQLWNTTGRGYRESTESSEANWSHDTKSRAGSRGL